MISLVAKKSLFTPLRTGQAMVETVLIAFILVNLSGLIFVASRIMITSMDLRRFNYATTLYPGLPRINVQSYYLDNDDPDHEMDKELKYLLALPTPFVRSTVRTHFKLKDTVVNDVDELLIVAAADSNLSSLRAMLLALTVASGVVNPDSVKVNPFE